MKARACLCALSIFLVATPVVALEIANVSHAPATIDPAKKQSTSVRFQLSESARVELRIFDGRDLLVRAIAPPKPFSAGEHTIEWNGRDEAGRVVPPEAYVYTLTAKTSDGKVVEHDLTDLTGNEPLPALELHWHADSHQIEYELSAPARVCIRAGLDNSGPLLRTVVDWAARGAGPHVETWDGKDASGLIDASHSPDLGVAGQAWALPKNSIVVLPPAPRPVLIEKVTWPEIRREKKKEEPFRERAIHQQPIERRGDVRLTLKVLPAAVSAGSAEPARIPIEIDVAPEDRERLLEQRFEVGFFVDGKHMFENEVGFLPMTWLWDPSEVNDGVHYVTGNVWGYGGQFGTTTISVRTNRK